MSELVTGHGFPAPLADLVELPVLVLPRSTVG